MDNYNNGLEKTIGVVVVTYNGLNYIHEQLDSIRNQSLYIHQVCVFDDCSQDNTYEYIKQYICDYNLVNWKIFRNDHRLGWNYNVFFALKSMTTDYIFWSDQDDIWESNRVEVMYSRISRDEMCAGGYCLCDYINEESELMYQNPNSYVKCKENKYICVDYGKQSAITPFLGSLACFSKKLLDCFTSEMFDNVSFKSPDWILYRIGILEGGFLLFNVSLVKRRIHDNNVTTGKNTFTRNILSAFKINTLKYIVYGKQLETLRLIKSIYGDKYVKNDYIVMEERYIDTRLKYYYGYINSLEYFTSMARCCNFSDFLYLTVSDTVNKYYLFLKGEIS